MLSASIVARTQLRWLLICGLSAGVLLVLLPSARQGNATTITITVKSPTGEQDNSANANMPPKNHDYPALYNYFVEQKLKNTRNESILNALLGPTAKKNDKEEREKIEPSKLKERSLSWQYYDPKYFRPKPYQNRTSTRNMTATTTTPKPWIPACERCIRRYVAEEGGNLDKLEEVAPYLRIEALNVCTSYLRECEDWSRLKCFCKGPGLTNCGPPPNCNWYTVR